MLSGSTNPGVKSIKYLTISEKYLLKGQTIYFIMRDQYCHLALMSLSLVPFQIQTMPTFQSMVQ